MYRIYFYNFDYTSQESFDNIEVAKQYGISKGFQFVILKG